MSRGFSSSYRIKLLAALVLAGFGVVGVQLLRLHVLDRASRLAEISKARSELDIVAARRGDILDDHGDTLATSRTKVALAIDPWALDDLLAAEKKEPRREQLRAAEQAKRTKLAELLGLSAAELEKYYQPAARDPRPDENVEPRNLTAEGKVKVRFVKFNDGVEESLYARLTDGKSYPQLDPKTATPTPAAGLVGARYSVRTYPHGQLAAHVVGYINKDEQPVTGIERFADFYLRGADGWRESDKDGRGRELAQFRTREAPAADGWSVILSLDAVVQNIVEQELAALGRKFEPTKATIVVSDPRTGFILALGNYPTFNLNEYNQVPQQAQASLKNIAATDTYEPGSVFKIVAASGALEEGLVTPASLFDCSIDKIDYGGRVRSLPREDHNFDHPLTVAEIISHSSNRGAAQLAMRLGDQRFYDYARSFGFGQRTGFPGSPEVPGTMASPDKWDGLTITRMPMGQSVAVTVLQMHQAMGVIASGGELLRPQIVRQVRDVAGAPVYCFERTPVHRVISLRTAQTMARLLMGVASQDGTAPEAAIPGFEVAGKTGTAQKFQEGKIWDHHHVASFIGFFPASRPQVAISVIVDDADAHAPGGVAYGAKVAAPAFKHIAEQLIPYLDIKPVTSPSGGGLFALEGARP
jgi:cell division protein FtsI/penicillin-binding protein 2